MDGALSKDSNSLSGVHFLNPTPTLFLQSHRFILNDADSRLKHKLPFFFANLVIILQYPLLILQRMQFVPKLDVRGSRKNHPTSTLLEHANTHADVYPIQREVGIV